MRVLNLVGEGLWGLRVGVGKGSVGGSGLEGVCRRVGGGGDLWEGRGLRESVGGLGLEGACGRVGAGEGLWKCRGWKEPVGGLELEGVDS